jgi:hypothetical protein
MGLYSLGFATVCKGGQVSELEAIREKLESVAYEYRSQGYTWNWDNTKMHLTIYAPNGDPFATLHVERTQ